MAENGEIVAKYAKVDYDNENDSLFVYTDKKANDSVELGNYVIDFDREDKVSGVEIFDISKMLNLSGHSFDLENIKEAKLSASLEKNCIYLLILLKILINNKIVEKELYLSVPRVSKLGVLN